MTIASTLLDAVACRIVSDAGKPPPDWVQLLPAVSPGGTIVARDGRKFKVPAGGVDVIAARFNELQSDEPEAHQAPFDFEHASEIKAKQGEKAEACGWITEMQARDNRTLWAHVEWNNDGASAISQRKYRYASPAMNIDRNGEIHSIVSAGLTNRPAMVMPALASASLAHDQTLSDDETTVALAFGKSAHEYASMKARAAAGVRAEAELAALSSEEVTFMHNFSLSFDEFRQLQKRALAGE